MKSSNPVLGRLVNRQAQHAGYQRMPAQQPYGGAGMPPAYGSPQTPQGYPPYAPARAAEPMTVDDVVVRTVAMLAVVGICGAAAWALLPDSASIGILIGAAMVGLVLGLVISLARITNPFLILTYSAVEGVFVGLISKYYADQFGGNIVLQAVVATFAVFFGMAVLYKFRIIRVTSTFRKWVVGALFGVLGLMLVNFVLAIFHVNGGAGLGLRGDSSGRGTLLAVGFSLLCIGIAALTFALDFDVIEQGVKAGIERRYAWYAAFGIVVGLIWLYLEILRLLGYARR